MASDHVCPPSTQTADPAWMPYFLDFLSRHEQSHLLLFWLEVGAYPRTQVDR